MPWKSRAVMIRFGGVLGALGVEAKAVLGRTDALREEGEKAGEDRSTMRPAAIFAASIVDPHPAEALLVAAATEDPRQAEELYNPSPTPPRAQLLVGTAHPE